MQADKELLLAALSLLREQCIKDACKELAYSEGTTGTLKQGHEKQADQLTRTAKNVIDLRERVLRTDASLLPFV